MGNGPDLGCAPAVTFVADGGRFVVRTHMQSRESRRVPPRRFWLYYNAYTLNLEERRRDGERAGPQNRDQDNPSIHPLSWIFRFTRFMYQIYPADICYFERSLYQFWTKTDTRLYAFRERMRDRMVFLVPEKSHHIADANYDVEAYQSHLHRTVSLSLNFFMHLIGPRIAYRPNTRRRYMREKNI